MLKNCLASYALQEHILVSFTTFNSLGPHEKKAYESSKIKEKKKKKKRKRKRRKSQRFALKPEHGPRGIWRKSLKPGALSQLVGSHRLSACYMGGWVRLSEM